MQNHLNYDRQGNSPEDTEANEAMARAMRVERLRDDVRRAKGRLAEARGAHRRQGTAKTAQWVAERAADLATARELLAEVAS